MRKLVLFTLIALAAGTASANLLLNYGFETDLTAADWSTTWGVFERETWNTPPEGSYAIYVKGTWYSPTNYGGGLQQVAVDAGSTYDLSASFYSDNGWSAGSQAMKLEFLDSSYTMIEAHTNTLSGLPDATWELRTITATAPVNAAYAQVVFEAGEVGDAGVLGADNFDFSAQVIPEPAAAFLGILGAALLCLRRGRKK